MVFFQEVQQTVAEKTSALEAEAFKTKRLQEDTAILKRKVIGWIDRLLDSIHKNKLLFNEQLDILLL